MRVICLYFEKSEDTQALAEVFYRLTPQIMLRGDRALFLEVSKCKNLYSEELFLKKVRKTLERMQIVARVSVAGDVPTALSQAVFQTVHQDQLPIECLKFYIDPLAEETETRQKVEKMKEAIAMLGVRRIGDFKKLTHKDLAVRFGQLGLLAKLRVQNETPVVWRNFTLREKVSEIFEFDIESPVENLEPIYFRLRSMIDKVVLRLRGRGDRVKRFDVVLTQEHALNKAAIEYRVSVLLQLPHVASSIVFNITREMIEAQVQRTPLVARVTGFRMDVHEVVPYRMSQKDLFDQKREENEESFFQFVSRVSTRLGREAVFFAKTRESFLPEKNWQRESEARLLKAATGAVGASVAAAMTTGAEITVPSRPLRLFSTAQRVRFFGARLVSDEIDEEIDGAFDKEVVFSDWWASPLERVYFRLVTKSGKNLWLYRTREGDFLHGVFD